MEPVLAILFLALIAVGVWWSSKPRPAFVVRIVDGRPVCQKGKVTLAFLHDLSEVCRRSGVVSGSIYGMLVKVPCGRACDRQQRMRIKLSFSSKFPRDCQQQLRNLSLVQQ